MVIRNGQKSNHFGGLDCRRVYVRIVGIWGQTPPEAPKRGFSLASDPVNHPHF